MSLSPSIYTLSVKSLEDEVVNMEAFKGKVTLVVNVASECGYTPQYAGLQKLHDELSVNGFAVLGFPSNEFGSQEPGDGKAIREFCTSKYRITFPLFAKVEVKPGPNQSPVYRVLTKNGTGDVPTWNFCKYLVGKDGVPIAYFSMKTTPADAKLRAAIEAALRAT